MAQNYEYDFVRVEPVGVFSKRPAEDYRVIIRDRAAEGWRLVTVAAPSRGGNRGPAYYELIFERVARA